MSLRVVYQIVQETFAETCFLEVAIWRGVLLTLLLAGVSRGVVNEKVLESASEDCPMGAIVSSLIGLVDEFILASIYIFSFRIVRTFLLAGGNDMKRFSY